MTKRCPKCGERKPLNREHFYWIKDTSKNRDGTPRTGHRWDSCCIPCKRAEHRAWQAAIRADPWSKAVLNEQRRRDYAARMADPVKGARARAAQHERERKRQERMKADPAFAEAQREKNRRANARRRALMTPEKLEAERQRSREYRRRVRLHDKQTRERQAQDARIRAVLHNGGALDKDRSVAASRWDKVTAEHKPINGQPTEDEAVDPAVFVEWCKRTFPGMGLTTLAALLNVHERRLRSYFDGDVKRVSLGWIDVAVTRGLGRPDLLQDLYPMEDTA